MKKIINGKLYNTETATGLARYSNDGGWRDFSHFVETLYRKKTGEFFLHGDGGGMTRYAAIEQDGRTRGEKIFPLTEAEAKDWMEKYATVDEYVAVFGEPEE